MAYIFLESNLETQFRIIKWLQLDVMVEPEKEIGVNTLVES